MYNKDRYLYLHNLIAKIQVKQYTEALCQQKQDVLIDISLLTLFYFPHYGHRHVNHRPIDHPFKCHENTNHSHVPQLPKAPIHTSKLKYVPNLLQA